MPDGQNGVLEILDASVNVERLPLVAPLPSVPQIERPAYVVESYKWENGNVGTNGGIITWAVVTAGQSYPSDSDYTSAATGITSIFMPTIRQAFTRWDEVGNFSFIEVTSPMSADIVLIFDELSGVGSSTIGLANTYYRGGVIENSYISFDIGRRYRLIDGTVQTVGTTSSTSTSDFYTLALHEIGHALGLDHENDLPTVMNSSQNSGITDLTSDEIDAIRYLYGPPEGTTADDYAGSTSTSGTIAIGSTRTGRIEVAADSDWFRITLTAGMSYRFDMTKGTLADPYLNIRNSSGTIVASDDNSGGNSEASLVYRPTTSGTYYVDARSANTTGTGTYSLLVTQSTPTVTDDYAGNASTTGVIQPGQTLTGNIETGDDRDWFRVTLTAGATYRIDLNGVTLADPLLFLRNSSGTIVASDDDSGPGLNATLTYTPIVSGIYYIDAQAATLTGTGTYSLVVTQTTGIGPGDDYPSTAQTTGVLPVGGSVTGNIEIPVDYDWFRVTLVAGETYQFMLQGAASSNGTLTNPFISLLNLSGTIIAIGAGTGGDHTMVYTPTSSGTYFVQARGSSTSTGTYLLSVTGPDDYTATTATTAAVTVGGSAAGNIETANDRDWFRVTLTAGQTYRVSVTGVLNSPTVSVLNSSGVVLVSDTTGNQAADGQLLYTATSSGTYFIEARSSGTSTGAYSVSLALGDDFTATAATAGTVQIGSSATGSIETAADVDWVRVNLTAGTLYRFDGRGADSNGGTLADPSLQLLNASGAVLVTDNNSGAGADASIMFRASASGMYYLAMRSNSPTATGTYTVAATANPDDFTATTATAGAVNVGGSTSGIVEVAGDRDWFRTTLLSGLTYNIRVTGTATGSALRWTESSVVLRDSAGVQVGTNTRSGLGASASLTYTANGSGTFYIDAQAYSSGIGGYTVSIGIGSGQEEAPAIAADTALTQGELAALTAPPAIALGELPLQVARSITVLVEDPLAEILTPPPAALFALSVEEQNRINQLFQPQLSNQYNLLPF